MKCLSVNQPWATLIVIGAKRYETRSWATSHCGPILIHASKTFKEACKKLCFEEPFRSALATYLKTMNAKDECDLPRGVIVGKANIICCKATVDIQNLHPKELRYGDFRPGRWAWGLDDATYFLDPIPTKGRLGIYEVDDCPEYPETTEVRA